MTDDVYYQAAEVMAEKDAMISKQAQRIKALEEALTRIKNITSDEGSGDYAKALASAALEGK